MLVLPSEERGGRDVSKCPWFNAIRCPTRKAKAPSTMRPYLWREYLGLDHGTPVGDPAETEDKSLSAAEARRLSSVAVIGDGACRLWTVGDRFMVGSSPSEERAAVLRKVRL